MNQRVVATNFSHYINYYYLSWIVCLGVYFFGGCFGFFAGGVGGGGVLSSYFDIWLAVFCFTQKKYLVQAQVFQNNLIFKFIQEDIWRWQNLQFRFYFRAPTKSNAVMILLWSHNYCITLLYANINFVPKWNISLVIMFIIKLPCGIICRDT